MTEPTTYHYDEAALQERLHRGDETAFARIVHNYYPRLLPFIYNITKSKPVAEELLQETFLRLWLKREDMPIEFLRAWLFRVASNLALNWLRTQAREKKLVTELTLHHPQQEPSIEEFLDYQESRRELQLAVAQLPDQQKAVLRLRLEQKLSNEEIARELGLSIFTVKNHLANAMRNLKQQLGNRNLMIVVLTILLS